MESMRVCAGGVPVRPLPNPRLVCEAGVKGWRATPVVAVELLLFPRSSPMPPVLGPGSAVVLMVPPRARKLYVELCCLGAVLLTMLLGTSVDATPSPLALWACCSRTVGGHRPC